MSLFDAIAGTTIDLSSVDPMDMTVVWTDPPRQMVCIEPWTGPRNCLNTGERILIVEPDFTRQLECKITFRS